MDAVVLRYFLKSIFRNLSPSERLHYIVMEFALREYSDCVKQLGILIRESRIPIQERQAYMRMADLILRTAAFGDEAWQHVYRQLDPLSRVPRDSERKDPIKKHCVIKD